jgi:diaminopimelate decarboxylase
VIAGFCDAVDFQPELLNVGGGLGIAYLDSDEPPSIGDYVDVKIRGVQRVFDPVPRILVEPGRSLVGNAGVTAYRVGTVKEIPGVRTYVAVDGGMSDNLRPMLYGSRYEAVIADRAAETPDTLATVAGMHCESGDVLIRDNELAAPRVGDVLVTPATGAYGYAMANNYNGVPRPPVIFCRDGEARVVVRRETWDDLLARDQ